MYLITVKQRCVCGLIFSLKLMGWLKPFLTLLGQDEVRDHQCSFYNIYRFENIIHINFYIMKIKKKHIYRAHISVNPGMLTMR